MAGNLTAMIASIFSGGVTPDPYYEYTTLLLPGSGTNGAQNNTFLDSSTNNFTITRNGNTTQGTFSPFSQTGWGNYFDGTGDYLTAPDNAAYTVGSGDWTLEAWVYPTASPNQPIIVGQWSGGSDGSICMILSNDGNRYLRGLVYSGGTVDRISGSSLQLNAWNHCAFVREGTFLNLYLNGSRVDNYSFGSGSIQDSSLVMSIGAGSGGIVPFQGYISNCRFLKGTAQYTGATYTVPTAPLTAITNTQLLTCQSNRFIDNSTNNFTITRNGDTRVVAFSPFNPTASWSAATYGGSGYFDGSGDYLTSSINAIPSGSTPFTVEAWIYPTAFSGTSTLFGGVVNIAEIQFSSTGISYNKAGVAGILSSSTALTLNAWNHIAVVRNGSNNSSILLNGVRLTTTASDSNTFSATTSYIGSGGASQYCFGYLSNFRFVVGTAVYDPTQTTYTVPTAPLTAITNTSLLLNFTNAGIYDATSKNDLETVGNAQISTTQSKFPPSSMLFDGTGDYLVGKMLPYLAFGSGDMTIECWVYPNTISGQDTIFDTRVSGAYGNDAFTFQLASGVLQLFAGSYASGGTAVIAGSSSVSTGVWTHLAISRASGTNRLFVNGSLITSNSNSWNQTFTSTNLYYVGQTIGVDRPFDGYIQDLRITTGYARYTTTFTPPTAAFPTL